MGGAYVAHRPDSTMPVFVNVGNPASYALVRLTTLELGLNITFSDFSGPSSKSFNKSSNFSYGALAFPIRSKGGACFGVMPFTFVGSTTSNTLAESGIGDVTYQYDGSGGLNKFFLGYGVMPFNTRLSKFRSRHLYIPDSLKTLHGSAYYLYELGAKLLNDLSIGANGYYIKGNISNTARVIYPDNTLFYNTFRDRAFSLSDVTGSFGIQTAFSVDSVRAGQGRRRALNEKVKFTFGYTFNINNSLHTTYNAMSYNYKLAGGTETIVDTVFYKVDQPASVKLPLEQGFGIGFKKGEKLNVVADYSITRWQDFRYLDNVSDLKQNQRIAIGANFVPEKYAVGRNSYLRRVNYRLGFNYQTGYIQVNNTRISGYTISAGLGLPVGIGRMSSMVHIGGQYGTLGTTANGLIRENFWRINIGFTFSDKWFQKYRYD